ncbi:MAG: DUF4838 domain-containing protein [Clostridia bacterium]|nr:DUF4838 domain-containing protein [Clostridia bacterium]
MLNNGKKLNVILLAILFALCMAFSVMAFTSASVVNAQAVTGVTPTLSATKVMVSKNNDKLLLVTAIKNQDDVYEVGYTFSNGVETTFAETKKYYTSITSGNTVLTPYDIFTESWVGDDGVGMIIWEINFALATKYEYKAYALVGERENGEIVIPEQEVRVTPQTATSKTFYSVSYDTDGGDAIETKVVPADTSLNQLTNVTTKKPGYKFDGWKLNGEEVGDGKVSGNVTLKATYKVKDYTEYVYHPVANTDVDLRTAGETVNVQLPATLNGYTKVYSKIGDKEIATEVKNNGASVDIAVADLEKGESELLLFMAKGDDCASAKIKLTVADIVVKNNDDLTALHKAIWTAPAKVYNYYVLDADVDWGGAQWYPGYKGKQVDFYGVLDGRGHTLANYNSHYGLCQMLAMGAEIKNIHLKPIIRGMDQGGGVCLLNNGSIKNCLVEAYVFSVENFDYAGVAKNSELGSIENCIVMLTGHGDYANCQKAMNAITVADSANIKNCYAINSVESNSRVKIEYLYGNSVTDGLFNTKASFFRNVSTLSKADGWNEYWSLSNRELCFNQKSIITVTAIDVEDGWVVKGGESEYAILVPDTLSYELNIATEELIHFFKEATGVELPIVKNSNYNAYDKYISLGGTRLASSVPVSEAELGAQGFKVVTVGNNVVINAVGDFGVLWGVYGLLNEMFEYKYYAKDVYVIDTNVENLLLVNYNFQDKPDIETRIVADSQAYEDRQVAHRMYQTEGYGEFWLPFHNPYHNSFYYVMDGLDANNKPIVPDRFLSTSSEYNKTQLCYTGHGEESILNEMLERSVDYIIAAVKTQWKYRTNCDALFGIQDENGWCECTFCRNVINQYGTQSSTMILFMNKLRERLDERLEAENIDRQINLYYFAYFATEEPPVHKENGEYVANDPALVCKEGLGIFYAPISANFTQSIYSNENIVTYERLKSFEALTDKLLVWTYACNYYDYFTPFDSFTYMPDLFQAVVNNNGTYLFNQGRQDQGNSSNFDTLRHYLVSRLGWDVDADVEALTDEFFDVYFGKAKEPMRDLYNRYRERMRTNYDNLGLSSHVFANGVINSSHLPKAALDNWMVLINQAYELAGNDEALRQRILRESIFIRYYQIKFYTTGDTSALKAQLIQDAKSVGILKASAHRSIDQLFEAEPNV